jgi:nucleotide-binding universal stress UspA family protein
MFTRIMVPLDGSARAERALPVAARLAQASGGTVILASVVNPMVVYGPPGDPPANHAAMIEGELAAAKDYLGRVAASGKLAGVPPEMAVAAGRPVSEELIEMAMAERADVVVMCSHGRSGLARWALGSVAQQVARTCPAPALILQADGPIPTGETASAEAPLRILVPLDGSPAAEAAIEPAAQLAVALAGPGRGTLHLLRIVEYPVLPYATFAPIDAGMLQESAAEQESLGAKARLYLHTVAQRLARGPLAALRLRVTSAVIFDADVASAIAIAGDGGEGAGEASDIIAMATHGRTGVRRLMVGSITERVLQATKRPLFVVRPVATATQGEPEAERSYRSGVDTAALASQM